MKAIAYTRVSTDEQADSALGLEAQQALIRRAALQQGLDIVSWHSDPGVSGGAGLEKRPGLMAAVAAMGPATCLIVAKLDRLSRDMALSAWLEKEALLRKSRIVSAAGEGTDGDQEDPARFLLRTIIQAFAHFERLMTRARTRAALAAKKQRGERMGPPPFGYRTLQGRLVPDEVETRTLARIRELAQRRPFGRTVKYAWIARVLTLEGHPPRQPGWNRRYVGWLLDGRMAQRMAPDDLEAARRAAGLHTWSGEPPDPREIARALRRAGVPPPPARWSAGQVRKLLAQPAGVSVPNR